MKKNILLLAVILLSLNSFSQNKNWQWVMMEGTSDTYGNQLVHNTHARQMGFDITGNIYSYSLVSERLFIDTLLITNMHLYTPEYVTYSYSCDGHFRWFKRYKNSEYYMSPWITGLITDPMGFSFVVGHNHFDSTNVVSFGDTTLYPTTANFTNGYFIQKIDSLGNTVFLNFPAPDGQDLGVYSYDAEQASNGNILSLTYFSSSRTWYQYSINHEGFYVVELDSSNGNIVNIFPLDMDISDYLEAKQYCFFNVDENDDFYLSFNIYDDDTIQFAGNTISNSGLSTTFLVKFDNNGNYVWHNSASIFDYHSNYQIMRGKPVVGDSLVYMSANTKSGANANFQNFPINNPIAIDSTVLVPVFVAFDRSNGIIRCLNYIQTEIGNECANTRIAIKDNLFYASIGRNCLSIINQTDTIFPYTNYPGYQTYKHYPIIVEADKYLSSFNWGKAMETTDIKGGAQINLLELDYNNNIYVGGWTTIGFISSNNDTVTEKSFDNFFIAKVASSNDSCGCPAAYPIASLVVTNNFDITVNCNARNILLDSAYVSWGDGDSTLCNSFNTNYTHTYSHAGPWDICLTTYGACGVERYCMPSINLTNLDEFSNDIQANIYPNPFNNNINIELNKNLFNAHIYIYNIVGELVYNEQLNGNKKSVDLSNCQSGIYIIKIISEEGNIVSRLIKE